MSSSTPFGSKLPERASLEYLKKLAKDRLRELRRRDAGAQLADALQHVARDHGFSSWRALKAAVDQRRRSALSSFFRGCREGNAGMVGSALEGDATLVRAYSPDAPHSGWTGLHEASKGGHEAVVRLLLDHGADPNAREAGDNTYPLHWAAAHGHLAVVRMLLDASGDVHGTGDVHALDVIGWATVFHAPDEDATSISPSRRDLVSLLLDRGARHHIFSAVAIGDLDLIRALVEDDPGALDRRLSRFEQGQSPLHFALERRRYDILDLLIELGADLEAEDLRGTTALAAAMLRGDQEAMRRLHAAGARPPAPTAATGSREALAAMGSSVEKGVPMFYVPDVRRALEWYVSIGFRELARYEDDGVVNFGMVAFGKAEIMLNMHGRPAPHDASLWFYTDRIDDLYRILKARRLDAARSTLDGGAPKPDGIEFEQDIEDMFYGARQFCIRDLNGYHLYFIQSLE